MDKKTVSLNIELETLAYDLGCFPLDIGPSRPMSDCYQLFVKIIMSFTDFKEI